MCVLALQKRSKGLSRPVLDEEALLPTMNVFACLLSALALCKGNQLNSAAMISAQVVQPRGMRIR